MCVQNRVRAWAEQGGARVGWGDNGGKWGDNGTGAMGEKKASWTAIQTHTVLTPELSLLGHPSVVQRHNQSTHHFVPLPLQDGFHGNPCGAEDEVIMGADNLGNESIKVDVFLLIAVGLHQFLNLQGVPCALGVCVAPCLDGWETGFEPWTVWREKPQAHVLRHTCT